ncbi:unnamed protein product [Symbiodinium necroappetens]|uniref:Uncharacterized protein n=1 Tax=Symbiodinium necroappetens TaxID=1628268 RepID=A0A812LQN8_9DINO|nr:unnamed protein product [Symbiodinium necroappetens]
MEPDVLPVFYFNDLLLSNIGDTIGLNLFEPRYQLMCNRMASDPRFLFMPNYEDYRCAPGDVGFVVRLTGLWQQAHGSSYGVQGYAEQLVAVSCAWEEPDTHHLHYAQYWKLDETKAPLYHKEIQALAHGMLQCGWTSVPEQYPKGHIRHFCNGQSEVLCGCNWPDRGWVLAFLADDDERHLKCGWTAGLPELVLPRFSGDAFLEKAVQCFPALQHGTPLQEVLEQLRSGVSEDVDAMRSLRDLQQTELGGPIVRRRLADPLLPKVLWAQLLSEARLSRVRGMPARMPTVRLEVDFVGLRPLRSDGNGGYVAAKTVEPSIVVLLSNDSNVDIRALPQDIELSAESARACLSKLQWQLNRLRLAIVHRARSKGQRPLAMLEDDVAQQMCDFVACHPVRPVTAREARA